MRIAVVDDDEELIDFVRNAVERVGYHCRCYGSGARLLTALRRETFDLLLLDWTLPDIMGIDLLRRIRASSASGLGVIMLTNRSDKDGIAEALRSGADDYIVKPESAVVIVARAEAVHRRLAPPANGERLSTFGSYEFDRLRQTIHVGGEPVPLTGKEFALALLFFENLHRPMSRGYILETVWQTAPDLITRTLDMHISKLRAKLGLRPENGYRIVAISGYGYRMEQFPAEMPIASAALTLRRHSPDVDQPPPLHDQAQRHPLPAR